MTTGRPPIGELDVLAYVDGQLEPQRRAEVEAYLALNPEEAAWVRDCLEQNELIRELYDRPFHEPVPRALARVLDRRAAPRGAASPLRRIAAALLLFLGGGVGGWWIGGSGAPGGGADVGTEGLLREMAAAHAEARAAGAADRPEIKLATDVGLPIVGGDAPPSETPDLSALGLTPVGRRVVAGPGDRPAVQLIYEDLGGRRVSLYLRPHRHDGGPEIDVAERGGLAVARWPDDPSIYGLAGDLPAEELAEIARAVDRAVRAVGRPASSPLVANGDAATGAAAVLAPIVVPPAAVDERERAGAAEM
jgi:anti-sigma factor RsiW